VSLRRLAVLAVVLIAIGTVAIQGPDAIEGRRLARTLARARMHEYRWRRPVLRGDAVEGNAAQCFGDAVRNLAGALEQKRDRVVELVEDHAGSPEGVPAEALALARVHEADLASIRDCGRRTWSWNPGQWVGAEDCRTAATLWLGLASPAEPAQCLATAADAIRFAQDCGAGDGTSSEFVNRVVQTAALVVNDCAANAPRGALSVASREIQQLAASTPPIGKALAALEHYEAGALVESHGGPFDVRRFLSVHTPELRAARTLLDRARQNGSLDARRFPVGLEAVLRQYSRNEPMRHRAASGGARVVESDRTSTMMNTLVDAATLVILRGTAIGLRVLARTEDGDLPEAPPPELAERTAIDPFTGRPMRWWRMPNPHAAIIYSVGPDRLDGHGTGPGRGDDVPVLVRRP